MQTETPQQIGVAPAAKSTPPVGGVSPDKSEPIFLGDGQLLNKLDERVGRKIPWIVKGLLAEGEQLLLFGAPKVGKSQFALQLALSVAMGNDFHKWEFPRNVDDPKERTVVYVNLEMGEQMFMIRVAWHVLAVTKPKSYRFPKTEGSAPEDEINKKPTEEDIADVNREIGDRFYFTDQIRRMTLMTPQPEKSNTNDTDKNHDLKDWKKIFNETCDKIQPDLIIFDTLSKMHNTDEKENNSIQNLLMHIRDMASAKPKDGESAGTNGARRRRIAHVIVHHARKQTGDFRGENYLSLDAIRGGSAIRAEADAIIGLRHDGMEENGTKRMRRMILEARNLPSDECQFVFDGLRFEQVELPKEKNKSDEEYLEYVRAIFLKLKIRGIGTGQLRHELIKQHPRGPGHKQWKCILKRLVDKSNFFKESKKNQIKKNSDKTPEARADDMALLYERLGNAPQLYWIHDASDWLNDTELREAFENKLDAKRLLSPPQEQNRT